MTDITRETLLSYCNGDQSAVNRLIQEIEAMDVNSLDSGWQLYLGYAVRRAWPELSLDQKVAAYLVAAEHESYSCG